MSVNPSSMDSFEPLLDSEQAAALVKVHPKTLQRYARTGLVRGYRIGKLWRFRASDLDRCPPLTVSSDQLSVASHHCDMERK